MEAKGDNVTQGNRDNGARFEFMAFQDWSIRSAWRGQGHVTAERSPLTASRGVLDLGNRLSETPPHQGRGAVLFVWLLALPTHG